MKTNYYRASFRSDHEIYRLRWGGYFRYPKTMNEKRFLCGARHDGEKVRVRRASVPTAWDDLGIARNYGKSWKDYTKNRRQWGRG